MRNTTLFSSLVWAFFIVVASTVTAESYVYTNVTSDGGSVTSTMNTNVVSSGESSTEVHVENKVESSSTSNTTSNVYRKTEVTVNGEKNVVESTTPGSDRIEIKTGDNVPTPSRTRTPTPTSTPSVTVTPDPDPSASETLYTKIHEAIRDFIEEIFK